VQVGDNEQGYHLTGAPLVVEGRVIVGVSGGEQGCRCYVDAYDAGTGARVWRWYTIPSPADGGWWGKWREADEFGQSFHRDIAQEKRDSARYAEAWRHGGGPVWQHPSYDPASGLVIFGVGNPAPDNTADVRPGDNLYTDCIVALDARTGKLKWYYQEVSHDRWDYDPMSPPLLVTANDSAGKPIPAVVESGKDGFLYVLDRRNGHPIRKSEPLTVLQNYMTPPTPDGVIMNPGTLGGNDWSPASYSPETGYVYVEENVLPMKYKAVHETFRPPAQWWGGVVVATPSGHYGFIEAVDPNTGRIVWQHRTEKPIIAGSIATAGGLVFTGTSDKKVLALDARTGDVLWSADAPAGVNAPPITYAIGGRQFVTVAATGIQTMNTPRGDALLAFALPEDVMRDGRPVPADSAHAGGDSASRAPADSAPSAAAPRDTAAKGGGQ
jgi:PQQ-dependent dehydrogenase (methanol/ethanol family)